MKRGFVVFMDALGFRASWKKYTPETVLKRMLSLRDTHTADIEALHKAASTDPSNLINSVEVAFLSDTVVLTLCKKSLQTSLPEAFETQSAAALTAGRVAEILANALSSEPVFTYRGAIAFGDFESENNFIVGSAVDEAAEWMDAAQGAFVLLAPSAQALVSPTSIFPCVIPYSVPLKGGEYYETACVNPFWGNKDKSKFEHLKASATASFRETRIDVQVKKQNTEKFFELAASATAAFLDNELAVRAAHIAAKSITPAR